MIACCSTILIGWIGNHRGFQAQQYIGIFERIHKVRMRGICFTVMSNCRHIIGNWAYCHINRISFRPLIGGGGVSKVIFTAKVWIWIVGNLTIRFDYCITIFSSIGIHSLRYTILIYGYANFKYRWCTCWRTLHINNRIATCGIRVGIKGIAIRRTMTKTTIRC